jgi:protein dithiol oxidoreductase (disulfide-forming)
MKRREFAAAAAATAALIASGAHAQRGYQEGRDYLRLEKPVPTEAMAGKVEVVEFFWYGCPHCNQFEPLLTQWSKKMPKDVVLKRVPIAFNQGMVVHQRLFYTLEALGKLPELHEKVFHSIHVEKQPLNSGDGILAWVQKQGLDKTKFTEIFSAPATMAKAKSAYELQEAFVLDGVPALGVAGRYYTDGALTGSMTKALEVTDYLIAEARKAAK